MKTIFYHSESVKIGFPDPENIGLEYLHDFLSQLQA